MRAAFLLAGFLSLFVTSLASAQAVYKWVDSDGVTHFSARPPRGVNAELTSIRLKQTDRKALQSRIDANAERNAATNTLRQKNKSKTAEKKADAEDSRKKRAENCEQAKKRQVTYNTARRLYRTLENGEREYLTDDELDKARSDAQALVDQWCD